MLVLYILKMTNQTMIKPIGLIHNMKILVHGILCVMTFTMMQNDMHKIRIILYYCYVKDMQIFITIGVII